MQIRKTLVAGAALGVFVGSGFSAHAKPTHHRHLRALEPAASEAELREEVQALKSQVQSLESRLDSQAQAEQRTQAQVQATATQAQNAQSAAGAAQAQAQSAQDQIKTIPGQVTTAVAAATPKPGWWANTTVGGTIFADVSNIRNNSDGVGTPQNGTDFDIKRFYLIVNHKFNDTWSVNATTDFIYDSGSGATQLFIKKAYLQAHLADALTIRAGSAELPWVPFVESLNGHRYVEKMLIDRTNFGTTTDWGLHAFGAFGGGLLSYQVSVIDGSGFKKPAIGTANRTSAVDVEGRVSANWNHFTVGVGGYSGKLGKAVEGVATFNTARRFDAVAAYTSNRFTVGGEYFFARDWNDVTQANPAKTTDSDGFSGFGSFNLTSKIGLFGRYDWVKPQKTVAPDFTENYFNVGVSYSPIPALDFALVYKRDKVDNGLFNTANGLIGGVPIVGVTNGSGTYDEIGVFTQIKF